MSDRITRTVELEAPIERVWRALTDHREFGTWFRVRLDGPFRVGMVTTGQMTFPGAERYRWLSTTVRIDHAAHVLAFTWVHSADPANPSEADPSTLVEFRLEATAGGTRATIVESGFAALPADRRDGIMRGNEQGWVIQSGHLANHVHA
jgi:uncharacterized protein YndB with AHSA1/START domain